MRAGFYFFKDTCFFDKILSIYKKHVKELMIFRLGFL